jgi:hypothetical protein
MDSAPEDLTDIAHQRAHKVVLVVIRAVAFHQMSLFQVLPSSLLEEQPILVLLFRILVQAPCLKTTLLKAALIFLLTVGHSLLSQAAIIG